MINKIKIIGFTVLVLLIGCTNSTYNSNEIKKADQTIVLPKMVEDINLLYSEICDTVKYVKLETNEECLIGSMSKIQFNDSLIYIGDFSRRKSILVFSITGSFLKKLDRMGKGPGEYLAISDFMVDDKNKLIYVYDNLQGKHLVYDLNFNLVNEFYNKGLYITSAVGFDNNWYIYTGYRENNPEYRFNFMIYDNKFEILDKKLPYEPIVGHRNWNHFRRIGSDMFMITSFPDKIYCYSNYLYEAYDIKLDDEDIFFDPFQYPKEKKAWDIIVENNLVHIYDFDLTNNWVFLRIQKGNANYFALHNVNTEKTMVGRHVINDLQYSLIVGIVEGLYDDHIVSYINPNFLLENFPPEFNKKYYGNINFSDNPIIVLAKLKS